MEINRNQSGRAASGLDALESIEWKGRAILLIDLDAFFASVEQLDHPGWRGKPVIVGGHADRRGVVSTCSYEARKYGVRSAMPSSTAERLCPDAIWTEGHYDRYREVSDEVMSIIRSESPYMQQVSIDEAFLDVTPTGVNRDHPVAVARRVQERVETLGVTCSIGVGTTKSVAKIASDFDKPKGLTVVMPGSEASFMGPLPVRALSGIGGSSEKKLKDHSIETLGQLAAADDELIQRLLGKNGMVMLARARCQEDSPVVSYDEVKSVSNETSFAVDLKNREDIIAGIRTMSAKVGRRLRRKGLRGHTLALKVRYADRSVRSVRRPLPFPSDDENDFDPLLDEMLEELWQPGVSIRLVGVAITGFEEENASEQLSLFAEDDSAEEVRHQNRNLVEASDRVKERFGEGVLKYGREFRLKGKDTGTTSKNPADYK